MPNNERVNLTNPWAKVLRQNHVRDQIRPITANELWIMSPIHNGSNVQLDLISRPLNLVYSIRIYSYTSNWGQNSIYSMNSIIQYEMIWNELHIYTKDQKNGQADQQNNG